MDRLQPSTYEEFMSDAPGVVIQGGRGVAQEPLVVSSLLKPRMPVIFSNLERHGEAG